MKPRKKGPRHGPGPIPPVTAVNGSLRKIALCGLVAAVAANLVALAGFVWLATIIGAGAMLMAVGVASSYDTGSVRTDNTPAGHFVPQVSKTLARCYPWVGPLTTILTFMRGGTDRATNVAPKWEEKKPLPVVDVAIDNSAVTAGNRIAVDVRNDCQWTKHDTVELLDDTGYLHRLIVEDVTPIAGGVTLDLIAYDGNSEASPPTISSGDRLLHNGVAMPEESGDINPKHIYPGQEFNYVQEHLASFTISDLRRAMKNYTVQDEQEGRNDMVWRYRLGKDSTAFFGRRGRLLDPATSRYRYMSGGTEYYIQTNKITFVRGSLTESTLMGWCRQLFALSNGSQRRFLFCGSELQHEIDTLLLKTGAANHIRYNKQILNNLAKLGLTVKQIHSTFGEVYMMYAPSFDFRQKSYQGQILDLKDIRRLIAIPTKNVTRTEKEHGKTMTEYRIRETDTIEVRCEEHHATVIGT